jgi:transcription antitermination protein NusB
VSANDQARPSGAGRGRARELAFRALFTAIQGESEPAEVWDHALEALEGMDEDRPYGERLEREALRFAEELLRGVTQNREEIDQWLERTIQGWSFGQMSQTDLNVLRLAAYELRWRPETQPPVTIEVAVRMAKRFGGEDSGRFVNGVLARLAESLDRERTTGGMAPGKGSGGG